MFATVEEIGLDSRKNTRHFAHFINGEYVSSADGQTFDDINPATGEVIATVSLGGEREIDEAVRAAKNAFENGPWPHLSIRERCDYLKKIGDAILARKDVLAVAESRDTGKPISESLNGDIPRSAMNFRFFADFAPSLTDDAFTVSENERHFGVREPVGVVGLITPWNLPLYLATWKIAPALAMGNTIVLKPAEWTPCTAYALGEICREVGLPPGVLNIVQGLGAGSAGEALTRHPDVRAISFTGETTTGKAIMHAAADTLKKISFELGGKGANIIFDDADLDEAIPVSVNAAFRNQGQICLAGSRMFVQESIYPQVLEELKKRIEQIRVGDPLDPKTACGPVISSEQMEKVLGYIGIGKQEGRILTGGERISEFPGGFYIRPTLIGDIANESRVCQEEIFGPVLPVVPFKTEEDAIRMANSTPYGLSASVWSRNVNRCHRVSRDLRTGIVWVNCWFARDLRTPFGGMKASGIGREGGRYSLEFFSEAKSICYRYGASSV